MRTTPTTLHVQLTREDYAAIARDNAALIQWLLTNVDRSYSKDGPVYFDVPAHIVREMQASIEAGSHS